jgi:hypothetical protein
MGAGQYMVCLPHLPWQAIASTAPRTCIHIGVVKIQQASSQSRPHGEKASKLACLRVNHIHMHIAEESQLCKPSLSLVENAEHEAKKHGRNCHWP